MSTKILAELVTKALREEQRASLSAMEQEKFHQNFEEEISPRVNKIREEERRVYEETQDLAFW